jgi:hypothetical protein
MTNAEKKLEQQLEKIERAANQQINYYKKPLSNSRWRISGFSAYG